MCRRAMNGINNLPKNSRDEKKPRSFGAFPFSNDKIPPLAFPVAMEIAPVMANVLLVLAGVFAVCVQVFLVFANIAIIGP